MAAYTKNEMRWRDIYYHLCVDGKALIWCLTCGEIFTIRETTWKRISKKMVHLGYLQRMGNCCNNPVWMFVTDLFMPEKGEPRYPKKNWIQMLKEEYQDQFIYEEILE